MAEYYYLANIDKREFIDPSDFGDNCRYFGMIYSNCKTLKAVKTLLLKEWRNDRIIWIGDSKSLPVDTKNEGLKELYRQTVENGYSEDGIDYILDTYKNVSEIFKNQFLEVKYVANSTKKLCYSLGNIIIKDKNGEILNRVDPLSYFVAFGRDLEDGKWLGDRIFMSDKVPEGYELMKEAIVSLLK